MTALKLLKLILKATLDNRRRIIRIETRLCKLAEANKINVKR
jgi:hypothetical protein